MVKWVGIEAYLGDIYMDNTNDFAIKYLACLAQSNMNSDISYIYIYIDSLYIIGRHFQIDPFNLSQIHPPIKCKV